MTAADFDHERVRVIEVNVHYAGTNQILAILHLTYRHSYLEELNQLGQLFITGVTCLSSVVDWLLKEGRCLSRNCQVIAITTTLVRE